MMKELEYCSECDKKLTEDEKEMNRDNSIDYEEWKCWECTEAEF